MAGTERGMLSAWGQWGWHNPPPHGAYSLDSLMDCVCGRRSTHFRSQGSDLTGDENSLHHIHPLVRILLKKSLGSASLWPLRSMGTYSDTCCDPDHILSVHLSFQPMLQREASHSCQWKGLHFGCTLPFCSRAWWCLREPSRYSDINLSGSEVTSHGAAQNKWESGGVGGVLPSVILRQVTLKDIYMAP